MYYVDRFLGILVKEKETYAAPERYYEYRKGTISDAIIETYIVSYNPLKLVDFAYNIESDGDMLAITRNNFFKKYNIDGYGRLYAYAVPPEWYEEEGDKCDRNERV